MHTHCIDKVITLISPIAINEPGDWKASPASDFVTTQGDFPSSKTKRIKTVGKDGNLDEVVFLPGSSLRGIFRTIAAKITCDGLAKRDQRSDGRELYYCIMSGAATAQPDGNPPTISEAIYAAKNPFVGSFGGGPKMAWGRLLVGHAMPITSGLIASGVIPEKYQSEAFDPKDSKGLTDIIWRVRKDPLRANNGTMPTIINNPEKVIADWHAKLADAKAVRIAEQNRKAEEVIDPNATTSKKTDLATVAGMEVIMPGVKFHARDYIDTSLAGPAMLGLYALTLAAFGNEQRIGGGAAIGNGRFVLRATCRSASGESFPIVEAIDGRYAPAAVPQIKEAVEAWEKFITTVTIAEFEKAYSLTTAE